MCWHGNMTILSTSPQGVSRIHYLSQCICYGCESARSISFMCHIFPSVQSCTVWWHFWTFHSRTGRVLHEGNVLKGINVFHLNCVLNSCVHCTTDRCPTWFTLVFFVLSYNSTSWTMFFFPWVLTGRSTVLYYMANNPPVISTGIT